MKEGLLRILAVSLVITWGAAQFVIACFAPNLAPTVRVLLLVIGTAALALMTDRTAYLPSAGATLFPTTLLLVDSRDKSQEDDSKNAHKVLRGLPAQATFLWWLPNAPHVAGVARADLDGTAQLRLPADALNVSTEASKLLGQRRVIATHAYYRLVLSPVQLSDLRVRPLEDR